MSHPVGMNCAKCGTEALVEVPEALMPVINNLEFICGDCGNEKA